MSVITERQALIDKRATPSNSDLIAHLIFMVLDAFSAFSWSHTLALPNTLESAKLGSRFVPITMLVGNIPLHYGVTVRVSPLRQLEASHSPFGRRACVVALRPTRAPAVRPRWMCYLPYGGRL